MDHSLSRKLNAVSMICLLIATTLAFSATLNHQPVIDAANALLAKNAPHESPADIAQKLHNVSVALKAFADTALADGTIAKMNAEVRQKKAQFLAPPNNDHMRALYEAAQDAGYQGGYNDFVRAFTLAQKQHFYDHGTSLGMHTVIVHIAETYEVLSEKISAKVQHPAGLIDATFHPLLQVPFVMLPETCMGIDYSMGFLFVYGSIATEGILSPVFVIASGIWFGPVRAWVC